MFGDVGEGGSCGGAGIARVEVRRERSDRTQSFILGFFA
jgi:hypothetical protein